MAKTAPRAEKTTKSDTETLIADNRKAFYDYHIIETFECGIALLGTEVKGIREGQANLRDSYARVDGGEVWLHNVHIAEYQAAAADNRSPTRARKLLLHRAELTRLRRALEEQPRAHRRRPRLIAPCACH